ncbi:hypothetical protein QUC31_019990 [Theobroma cacao]
MIVVDGDDDELLLGIRNGVFYSLTVTGLRLQARAGLRLQVWTKKARLSILSNCPPVPAQFEKATFPLL